MPLAMILLFFACVVLVVMIDFYPLFLLWSAGAHLRQDDAPAGACRHGLDQVVSVEALALHGHVAGAVRSGAAHNGDVDGQRLVNEILLAEHLTASWLNSVLSIKVADIWRRHLDFLDEFVLGDAVELSPAKPGVC
jgi:hypothetical protein